MVTFQETDNAKRDRLKDFYYKIKDCKLCDLHETRINFVFGSGNSNASIIFIGEAPGRNEDLQGKPFVGQAGRLLDELLLFIGFNRNDVFIANVLKCRPPENRDPSITEINTCKNYLFRQIEIIDPKIVCTMGRYSTQVILDTSASISKLRGKVFKISQRIVLPINHPAAVLYTPSKLQVLREDFKRIKDILDNYEHPETVGEITEISGLKKMDEAQIEMGGFDQLSNSDQNDQLGLF
jgi:DNA polymerase